MTDPFLRKSVAVLPVLLHLLGGPLVAAEPPDAKPSTKLAELAAQGKPTNLKVVLVGIDGATFKVLTPLLDQGRVPQFKKLIDGGAHGILKSLPRMVSPSIWTTIVTGREPKEHGITDFVIRNSYADTGGTAKSQLVTSNDRKKLALWNILGPLGKTVGFVGWWATWPAEPVSGWMVSDRITRTRFTDAYDSARTEARTFPDELAEAIRPLTFDPLSAPTSEIRKLIDLTPEEVRQLEAARGAIFGHGLSLLKYSYCEQRTYEEVALRLLSKRQPDLTGIFLIMNDPVSHSFWHLYEPELYKGVDPALAKRQGSVIPRVYEHNDGYLAKLLPLLDRNTVVMIVSDHGFEASGVLPQTRPAKEVFSEWFDAEQAKAVEGTVSLGQPGKHHVDGIFIAAGGPIRKGVSMEGSVLDIAPTVLALLGLPVPEDMKGRVLTEVLNPDFLVQHPIRRIPSYEPYIPRSFLPARMSPEEEERKLEVLRSLGYIK